MRPLHLSTLAASMAAACLFLVGCGGVVDRDDDPLPKRGKGRSGTTATVAIAKFDAVKGDYKGVVKGRVVWQGAEPDTGAATESLRKTIGGNNDAKFCLSGTELEKSQQAYRIGKNKGLGNVFVWISPPKGQAFDVPDAQLPKSKAVVLSQPHCAFLPHCSSVFASRYKDGKQDAKDCQVLEVQNDASVPHNASMTGGSLNGTRNELLGAWSGDGATKKAIFALKPEKDTVKIACGVHAWMSAFVRVYDHPYNAVTSVGADFKDLKKPVWENLASDAVGTFEFTGAPIGAKVLLFAWHEELGHLLGQGGKEITISATTDVGEIAAKGK